MKKKKGCSFATRFRKRKRGKTRKKAFEIFQKKIWIIEKEFLVLQPLSEREVRK